MNLRTIRDETGIYIEIPRDRITFKSKEAKIIFDLTLENDELRLKNQELKERLERIDNYLDKYYTVENQYWFDHIRDIVEDR